MPGLWARPAHLRSFNHTIVTWEEVGEQQQRRPVAALHVYQNIFMLVACQVMLSSKWFKKTAERTDTSGWSAEMERRGGKQVRWFVNGEKRQFHHKMAWIRPELQNQRKSWCKSSINNNNFSRVSTLCSCLMCSMLDLIRTNSISSFTSALALIKSLALPFSHPQETELFLISFHSMESL